MGPPLSNLMGTRVCKIHSCQSQFLCLMAHK